MSDVTDICNSLQNQVNGSKTHVDVVVCTDLSGNEPPRLGKRGHGDDIRESWWCNG